MFKIKLYNESEDYETFCKFWDSHKWPHVEKQFLPKTGIIVLDNKTPICGGFIYKTDSKICLMEWIVADKKLDKKKTKEGLNKLIKSLSEMAKRDGYNLILSSLNSDSLIDRCKEHEFLPIGKNITSMIKRII